MPELPSYEDYAALVNTKFSLADAENPLEIELVEVTEPVVTTNQTHFSLYFRSAAILPQQTYRLIHEKLGEQFIFLVPTARDANGCVYEAVFNTLN